MILRSRTAGAIDLQVDPLAAVKTWDGQVGGNPNSTWSPTTPLNWQGAVAFNNGDAIGYEQWKFTLNPGATNSVLWNNDPTNYAVAKWSYGQGRAVYLDFHYITSDCSLATAYGWGKQLVYNSVLWAGKAL